MCAEEYSGPVWQCVRNEHIESCIGIFGNMVAALERAGELVRVAAEVDPVLEIAELIDRESKRPGGGRAL